MIDYDMIKSFTRVRIDLYLLVHVVFNLIPLYVVPIKNKKIFSSRISFIIAADSGVITVTSCKTAVYRGKLEYSFKKKYLNLFTSFETCFN